MQCFEHAECIAIDTFDVFGNEWLNAPGLGALTMLKKKYIFLNNIT